MIAIPNMDMPKSCAECFRILKCKSVPRWITADDGIPKDCPLIEIDDEIWEALKPKVETMSLAKKGWITDVVKGIDIPK